MAVFTKALKILVMLKLENVYKEQFNITLKHPLTEAELLAAHARAERDEIMRMCKRQ